MKRKGKSANWKIIWLLCASAALSVFFSVSHFINVSPDKPNVILITIDTLRADHLGCYGYKLNTSPHIDNFAKEAAIFTQAITQGSKTCLALPSIHTSTYPRTHGCYSEYYEADSSVPRLSEVLKKYNYATAAFVEGTVSAKGLKVGFDVCCVLSKKEVMQEAVPWLQKNYKKRFFMWVHYLDPHGPYQPIAPYDNLFTGKFSLGKRFIPAGINKIPYFIKNNAETDVNYFISQYDGEIRFTDDQIGLLLANLKRLGIDKNSIVVITADHGEMLGEHDIYFTHMSLYDENIRVPLLVRYKKMIPRERKISYQVKSIDIAPTILEFLGLPRERRMQGNSFFKLIRGKDFTFPEFAYSEHARDKDNFIEECVRTSSWKLIYTKDTNNGGTAVEYYELYNLTADPGEIYNLAALNWEKLNTLKEKLDNWRRSTLLTTIKQSKEFTEKEKTELRSLGYLQ